MNVYQNGFILLTEQSSTDYTVPDSTDTEASEQTGLSSSEASTVEEITDNSEEQYYTLVLEEVDCCANLLAQQYSLSLFQTGVITAVFVLLLLYKFINLFFNRY